MGTYRTTIERGHVFQETHYCQDEPPIVMNARLAQAQFLNRRGPHD